MGDQKEILENLFQELKRGTLVLSVLSQLVQPKYGYALVQNLEEKGVPIEAGTLYPLLRRLEKQELLESAWETSGSKPRKYYVISQEGRQIYEKLCQEWNKIVIGMDQLMKDGGAIQDGE